MRVIASVRWWFAGELAQHDHVDRVGDHDASRERTIDAYFYWHASGKRVTVVSGKNAEAGAINDAIQQRRVDQGDLNAASPRGESGSSASSSATPSITVATTGSRA